VLTSDEAKQCLDAGAEFLVSPGVSVPVMSTARACGKLAVPGALTPTELMNAYESGARLIKIFPCGNLGGPKYLKSLRGPFPNVSLVPTGGVNALNAADYMAAGAFAFGVGTDLVDIAALREGNSVKIASAAHELVAIVKRVRSARLQ
jgi:2-dehydro-3-deoxyphosphogluconate aldolase / (4S)-4-hydroxy-2-oxoglutarate aldolase